MDNNSSFEQQFTQNLKASAMPPAEVSTATSSKLPLVVAIALAAITLVESIALIVTLTNYFSLINSEYVATEEEVVVEESPSDDVYIYDADYNLKAASLSCTAEDGSVISLDTSNKYTATGALSGSGTYTITNDSLISLSGSDKVLYYDGLDLADGLTLYTCEEVTTNSES